MVKHNKLQHLPLITAKDVPETNMVTKLGMYAICNTYLEI